MDIVDMKPWDRRAATLQLAERFVRAFFAQNPISACGRENWSGLVDGRGAMMMANGEWRVHDRSIGEEEVCL